MEFVAIVAVLALMQYIYFAVLVGQARGKFGVNGPAVTGHPVFERYFRVQMNTLELLIALLPGLWLFAYYVSPTWAAILARSTWWVASCTSAATWPIPRSAVPASGSACCRSSPC